MCYDYQFWLTDPAGTSTMVQDYGNGETFAWTPAAAGSWLINVRVKNLGSLVLLEASASVRFDVVIDPPAT